MDKCNMTHIPRIRVLRYNYLDKHKCLSKRLESCPFLHDTLKVYGLLEDFGMYVPY